MNLNRSFQSPNQSLGDSSFSTDVRTPAQNRLKRLQSNLQEQQKKSGGALQESRPVPPVNGRLSFSQTTPDHDMEKKSLKRKSVPMEDDREEETSFGKKFKLENDKNKILERKRAFRRSRPRNQDSSSTIEDVIMTEADVVDQINSFRDKKSPPREDYTLSISISADNKLVIDYSDTRPEEKSLKDRLLLKQKNLDKVFYIVIDTNIFCHNLLTLVNLMDRRFSNDLGYPVLVIPYVVLEELDRLKSFSRGQISLSARRAITFINDHFKTRNAQLKGQSAQDQRRHCIEIKSPDDHILNSCLQIKEFTEKVILLTNDVNLRNKSFFNSCQALSMDEINTDSPDIHF